MYIPVTTYPEVPPHNCPGRTVTCPDCGQPVHVAPTNPGPIWVVPTWPTITYPHTSTS